MLRWLVKGNRIMRIPKFSSTFHSRALHNVESNSSSLDHDYEEQYRGELLYLLQNKRYKMFNKKDRNRLYEFDNDSRLVIKTLQGAPVNQMCLWQELPEECSNEQLIKAFANLLCHCKETDTELTSEKFDDFIDRFVARIPSFTLNELIHALQLFAKHLVPTDFKGKRNVTELFTAFDEVCTIKSAEWSLDQILFICGIWQAIPRGKKSYFVQLCGRKVNRTAKTMSAEQLTQGMFLLNCLKQPIEDIRNFEPTFESKLESMSLEDIAVISGNFKRLDASLQSPELLKKYCEIVTAADLTQMNEKLLSNIIWLIQKSARANHIPFLITLLHNLKKNIEERSIHMCIDIVYIGNSQRICDTDLTEYVYRRLLNESSFQHLSISEMMQLSHLLGNFHNAAEARVEKLVGDGIISEIRNRLMSVTGRGFYLHLIETLQYLSYRDIYDIELLENLLRQDFVTHMYGKLTLLDHQLYFLNNYAILNLREIYSGPQLDDIYIKKMGKFLTNYVPDKKKSPKREHFILEVEDIVADIFKHYQYANAISHRKFTDIFVCINTKTGEAVDVASNYPPLYTGQLITAESVTDANPDLQVFVFLASGARSFWNHGAHYTGLLRQTCDQFELLGFHPIVIAFRSWKNLTEAERGTLIREEFKKKFNEVQERQLTQ